MVRPLPLAQHTLYADLLDQGADDLFDPEFLENGSVLIRANRAKAPAVHAYYQGYRPAGGGSRGQRYARYLGRADDPAVAARIARFRRVKAARAERTTTVRALIGAGMPRPDRVAGRIIEALARAGLFPDHAVLIGEAAYQTYDGVLGVRLTKPRNAGRARPAVEIVVRDTRRSASILPALRTVDPSFAIEATTSGSCCSATGAQVAVTSLDRSADEKAGLVGYLIADPVRAVVMHGPGIPVDLPAPERYAVHTLIVEGAAVGEVAEERTHSAISLAAELIEALLCADRAHALAKAFAEVREVWPHQQRPLKMGIARLPQGTRLSLSAVRGT